MAPPRTMTALKILSKGHAGLVRNVPVPKPRPGWHLCKVSHVACNPTDVDHIDSIAFIGGTVGCDLTGEVVELATESTTGLQVGDVIGGVSWGDQPDDEETGVYGEYALVRDGLHFKVPPSMSKVDASTFGIGATTVALAVYKAFNIPLPDPSGISPAAGLGQSVLIYGGSTATGLFAMQFARLSGFHVVATSSPHNFDKCREFGAHEVFDYKDGPECAASIRKATGNKLLYAFDTISAGSSGAICAGALTTESGKAIYSILRPDVEFPRDDVTKTWTLSYTAFGREFTLGKTWPQALCDANRELAVSFWTVLQQLLIDGKIKTFATPRDGGLEAVSQGIDDLRHKKVSATKLVYQIG